MLFDRSVALGSKARDLRLRRRYRRLLRPFLTPKATLQTTGAVDLAAGVYSQSLHCARIISGGTLRCWGENLYGGIGDGSSGSGAEALIPTAQKW
jgi:hypothetical protein